MWAELNDSGSGSGASRTKERGSIRISDTWPAGNLEYPSEQQNSVHQWLLLTEVTSPGKVLKVMMSPRMLWLAPTGPREIFEPVARVTLNYPFNCSKIQSETIATHRATPAGLTPVSFQHGPKWVIFEGVVEKLNACHVFPISCVHYFPASTHISKGDLHLVETLVKVTVKWKGYFDLEMAENLVCELILNSLARSCQNLGLQFPFRTKMANAHLLCQSIRGSILSVYGSGLLCAQCK